MPSLHAVIPNGQIMQVLSAALPDYLTSQNLEILQPAATVYDQGFNVVEPQVAPIFKVADLRDFFVDEPFVSKLLTVVPCRSAAGQVKIYAVARLRAAGLERHFDGLVDDINRYLAAILNINVSLPKVVRDALLEDRIVAQIYDGFYALQRRCRQRQTTDYILYYHGLGNDSNLYLYDPKTEALLPFLKVIAAEPAKNYFTIDMSDIGNIGFDRADALIEVDYPVDCYHVVKSSRVSGIWPTALPRADTAVYYVSGSVWAHIYRLYLLMPVDPTLSVDEMFDIYHRRQTAFQLWANGVMGPARSLAAWIGPATLDDVQSAFNQSYIAPREESPVAVVTDSGITWGYAAGVWG